MGWQPTENGGTLGTAGSEGGVILRDEEHDLGARITLERHCSIAPFAVTCGIYGWFFHTRFASTETEAEYSAMSSRLEVILDLIPLEGDPQKQAATERTIHAIEAFVSRFP